MSRSVMQKADRLVNIVRYHRPGQLARRLWNRLATPIETRLPRRSLDLVPPLRQAAAVANSYRSAKPSMTLSDLPQGHFCLLNLCASLGSQEGIDWSHPLLKMPPLWEFQLHYHEYLAALAPETSDDLGWQTIWTMLDSWMTAHPRPDRHNRKTAWHPYCISRRIPVWALLVRLGDPEPTFAERLQHSLAEQALYLATHLERDIGGNHLWENAKAIVTAGCHFSGPLAQRWLDQGFRLLADCFEIQITEPGEHFEKSPGYQADLIRGLFDLAGWLQDVNAERADHVRKVATQMQRFLAGIRHPDGSVPLFGDSTQTYVDPLSPGEPDYSARPGQWVGEYYVHREGHHLVFDAGNIGPDELPAHSHADLLGFEASLWGQRFFVDSGIHSYTGLKRNQYRKSASHNVLTIDGEELADVWSSFRVGRRGHVLERRSGVTSCGQWAWATHDAYRHRGITAVGRLWFFADDGHWFSVHWARGSSSNTHQLTEHLHLHPDVDAWVEGTDITMSHAGKCCLLQPLPPCSLTLTDGVWSPDFYVERQNTHIVLEKEASLPGLTGWCLSLDGQHCSPHACWRDNTIVLQWKSGLQDRSASIPVV